MTCAYDAERNEEPPILPGDGSLPLDRPWTWLERGWRDFTRAPEIGLFYGFGLVACSWALTLALAVAGEIHLLLPFTGGFFIVAPLLVAGLYDTSRRLELGERPRLGTALMAWRAPGQLALMGAVLLLLHLAWIRVALLLYPLFFHSGHRSVTSLPELLGTSPGLALLVIGGLIGGLFALIAFCISAVSLPMLVDRDVSVIEAILASVQAVRRNRRAMLFWGILIVGFTAAGIATLFVGLAVIAPVIAHATWHAYRDAIAAPP
ncbi:DUF2189 domain-containing protein [Vineibacter terrae]|uniref:DUF2189 domain-containing protein n=1 Tax=Vineibacter terrae TaxID=2586908 RepID=A0A5C8PET1_9HYPH|nr:DUF2189 domain-containing protein [Vineibacter terrae]TXL71819.1 DUF2189 domain-containing protein [Vineibacter terrae]